MTDDDVLTAVLGDIERNQYTTLSTQPSVHNLWWGGLILQ